MKLLKCFLLKKNVGPQNTMPLGISIHKRGFNFVLNLSMAIALAVL